jgi:hypothetical protein
LFEMVMSLVLLVFEALKIHRWFPTPAAWGEWVTRLVRSVAPIVMQDK